MLLHKPCGPQNFLRESSMNQNSRIKNGNLNLRLKKDE